MANATEADIQSVVGTTISVVAGYPATFDESGYAALTYTKIGLIEGITLPESSYEEEVFNILDSGDRVRILTFLNGGDFSFALADVPEEDGQAIVIAHHDGASAREPVSFEVAQSNGATRYLSGKVMSYSPAQEALNRASYSIAVDKTMVYVAPTP